MSIPTKLRGLLSIRIDRRLVKDYRQVFTNDIGQRVLLDLITRFHVMDACKDQFEEGERRVILHIMAMAQMNASQLPETAKKIMEQE